MVVQDYDGATVVDATGEAIGTVERSYVDDDGAVRMVRVKLGKLFAKHRLVPVDDVRRDDDTLRIPYAKQVVEDAPDVDVKDTLEGEGLEQVRAYYVGTQERLVEEHRPIVEERPPVVADVPAAVVRDASVPTGDDAGETARIRDRGDTIEIPIVEEELVKRPVVKEVLRVRKQTVSAQQQVSEELRKEDVEIEGDGDVEIRTEPERGT